MDLNKIYIGSRASAIDKNNNLWMSNYFFNGLFKANLNDKSMQFVGPFIGESADKREMHGGAYPYVGNTISVYNMADNEFSKIDVPKEYGDVYTYSICKNENMFFSSYDGNLINFNVSNMKLKELKFLSDECKKFYSADIGNFCYSTYENGFVFFNSNKKSLLNIKLDDQTINAVNFDFVREDIEIAYYDGYRYLFSVKNSKKIIACIENSKDYVIYNNPVTEWGKDKFRINPYNKLRRVDNLLIFSNYNAKYPIVINEDANTVSQVMCSEEKDIVEKTEWGPIYSDIHVLGDDLYFIPCCAKNIVKYNYKTNEYQKIETGIEIEAISTRKEVFNKVINKTPIIKENDVFSSFAMFIDCIS